MGDVVSVEGRLPRGRGKVRHILEVHVKDSTGFLSVVWFNQAYLQKQIKVGQKLLLHGKVDRYGAMFKMASPKHQIVGGSEEGGDSQEMVPLYPLCDGLTQTSFAKSSSRR